MGNPFKVGDVVINKRLNWRRVVKGVTEHPQLGTFLRFDDEYGSGDYLAPAYKLFSPAAAVPSSTQVDTSGAGGGGVLKVDRHLNVTYIPPESYIKLPEQPAKRGLTCDCGGAKTYGMVSKETCAGWCSSQEKA